MLRVGVIAVLATHGDPGLAQQQPRPGVVRRGPADRGTPKPDAAPLVLEPTAPIANLFARAEEGVARSDWKFVIDCLQRIIEEPQDSMVQAPEGAEEGRTLYESARRRAVRRLASLPPDGLEAYRVLYDGRAKRLFERGRLEHDAASLTSILTRYPLSRYADDAADLLASWALDEGRPAEAVRVLADAMEFVPDRDVPAALIDGKLAAAYALLGRHQEAGDAARRYRAHGSESAGRAPRIVDAILTLPSLANGADGGSPGAAGNWEMAGGSAHRRNRMPPVEPLLAATSPWRFDLPGVDGDPWRRTRSADPHVPLSLPVGQMVIDGSNLFVRTRWGCAALDPSDLSVRWETDDVLGIVPELSSADRLNRRQRADESWTEQTAFEDYAAGAVAGLRGTVYVLSREGSNTFAPARPDVVVRDEGNAEPAAAPPAAPDGTAPRSLGIGGNRLIALDAESGRVRWQRGRTGHVDDPLGLVEFASVPILLANELWAPYRKFGDLHVAVLDPTDGRLLRSILLCSLGRPLVAPWFALPPAAADGLVFVPTARGVLFAVESSDRTIRWASQYSTAPADVAATAAETGHVWPAGAPVVTGGLVLLLPPRQKELICFAAASGRVLWTASLGTSTYIIAADHERVWLGGKGISCLSLTDGRGLWTADLPSGATGHAVLSESSIHVPTVDGLVTLDAVTGESVAETSLPVALGPMGNVLCLRNAMYSINPARVRLFPDIGRSYAESAARVEADPSDAAATVRLAWLELLKREPRRALLAINRLPPDAVGSEGPGRDAVSRVRVEALLTLATANSVDKSGDADPLSLLEEADRIARTPADRLRCAFAIADQLAAREQYLDAYHRLWHLGLSSDADQVMPISGEVVATVRFEIARRLGRLAERVPPDRLAQALSSVATKAEEAGRRLQSGASAHGAEASLTAIADLTPPGSLHEAVVRTLADAGRQSGAYEQAEQLIRHGGGAGATPAGTAGRLIQTSRIYSDLASFDDRALYATLRVLEELGRQYGGEPMVRVGADGIPPKSGGSATVGDWIEEVRSRFPSEAIAAARERGSAVPVQLTGQLAWTREWAQNAPRPAVVEFAEPPPVLLADRMILYTPDNRLACYDADNFDEPVWQTSLRVPGTFESDTAWMRERPETDAHRAVADGQTAVFADDDGLFAIGLVTGRRLWVRSFEPPGLANRETHPDTAMAAGDGLLAATPRAGRLTLMRLRDGATVWERDLFGEPVAHVWMHGDRIVTADAGLRRVLLVDRGDGSLLRQVLFEQPDPDSGLIGMVLSGGVLCGPLAAQDFEGVAAVDLRNGETLWRLPVEKPLAQIFRPRDGFVGISLLGGDVWIVDALTGEVQINHRVAGAHSVVDGLLVDGTLVVQHANPENEGRLHHLTGLDVATQEEIWRRTDIVPTPRGSRPLRVAGGMIPAFVSTVHERARGNPDVRAALVDPRTGLSAGIMTPLPSVNAPNRVPADFEVFPGAGVAIVNAPNTMFAIRVERLPGAPKGF